MDQERNPYAYKPINHFYERLNLWQGHGIEVPDYVFEMISREAKSEGKKDITRTDITRYIKKNRSDYIEYRPAVDYIYRCITGKHCLHLSHDEKKELGHLFSQNEKNFIREINQEFESIGLFRQCINTIFHFMISFPSIRDKKYETLIESIQIPTPKIYKNLMDSPVLLLCDKTKEKYHQIYEQDFNKPPSYMKLYKYIHEISDQTTSPEDENYICAMFQKINEIAMEINYR